MIHKLVVSTKIAGKEFCENHGFRLREIYEGGY